MARAKHTLLIRGEQTASSLYPDTSKLIYLGTMLASAYNGGTIKIYCKPEDEAQARPDFEETKQYLKETMDGHYSQPWV